jgi:hypothetical protein
MRRPAAKNLATFERMFLSLGPDAAKLDGTRHDSELMEAKIAAASRWHRLVELEGQIVREEQALAARPKTRPQQPNDDLIAPTGLKRLEDEFAAKADYQRASLDALKEQAAKERAELTSFVVKNAVPREER